MQSACKTNCTRSSDGRGQTTKGRPPGPQTRSDLPADAEEHASSCGTAMERQRQCDPGGNFGPQPTPSRARTTAAHAGKGKDATSNHSEIKNRIVARKSIHLNKDVFAGHIILFSDLIMKRPGDGISPMKVELVIGKRVNWELKKGDKLKIKDLKG